MFRNTDLPQVSLDFPLLPLLSGFQGSPPGLLGSSSASLTVRVPRISARSPWIFLCFPCRQGSADLAQASLDLPLLSLPSGFHESPPGLLGSSPTSFTVRVPRISPSSHWGFLCFSYYQGPVPRIFSSYFFGFSSASLAVRVPRISLRSHWVFLCFPCRQGSTDLPQVSLGLPLLPLPSGFHGSPPGLTESPSTFLAVRVPRISPRSHWVYLCFPCRRSSTDLTQVSLGLLLLLLW